VSDEARERPAQTVEILDGGGSSLLEAVDSLLNRGVLVEGDLVLGLAPMVSRAPGCASRRTYGNGCGVAISGRTPKTM